MTTVVKMVGKPVENIEEIRAYIKVCKRHSHSVMQILLNWVKFIGLIRYLMRQLVVGERNF